MVSGTKADEQSQRHMEHEIRDTITKLTRQLTALGKSSARSLLQGGDQDERADDHDGVIRIVTLAGGNKGAKMEASLEDQEEMMDGTHDGALYADEGRDQISAHTNSNYQAINNSILLDGCCAAEDPGVHIVISSYANEDGDGRKRREEGEKKKDKETKEKEEGDKGEKHPEEEGDGKSGDGK